MLDALLSFGGPVGGCGQLSACFCPAVKALPAGRFEPSTAVGAPTGELLLEDLSAAGAPSHLLTFSFFCFGQFFELWHLCLVLSKAVAG